MFPAFDLDFFRVISLMDAQSVEVPFSEETTDPANWSYAVSPGEEYRLEVAQRTYTGLLGNSALTQRRNLVFLSLGDEIRCRSPIQPILGKYSVMEYTFVVSADAKSGVFNPQLLVEGRESRDYGVSLPMYIRASKRARNQRLIALACFCIATFVYVVPVAAQSILELFPFSLGPTPDSSSIEKTALIVMLVSANASDLTRWIADRTQLG